MIYSSETPVAGRTLSRTRRDYRNSPSDHAGSCDKYLTGNPTVLELYLKLAKITLDASSIHQNLPLEEACKFAPTRSTVFLIDNPLFRGNVSLSNSTPVIHALTFGDISSSGWHRHISLITQQSSISHHSGLARDRYQGIEGQPGIQVKMCSMLGTLKHFRNTLSCKSCECLVANPPQHIARGLI